MSTVAEQNCLVSQYLALTTQLCNLGFQLRRWIYSTSKRYTRANSQGRKINAAELSAFIQRARILSIEDEKIGPFNSEVTSASLIFASPIQRYTHLKPRKPRPARPIADTTQPQLTE